MRRRRMMTWMAKVKHRKKSRRKTTTMKMVMEIKVKMKMRIKMKMKMTMKIGGHHTLCQVCPRCRHFLPQRCCKCSP